MLYDVLFTEYDRTKFFVQDEEWTGAKSDEELATSARGVPLVLPGDAVPEALEGGNGVSSAPAPLPGVTTASASDAEDRPVFVPPIAPVAAAGRAVAHNFAVLDPDGPWRRYVPFVRNQEEQSRRWRSPRRRWR